MAHGKLIVISAPSGAGKTTIANALLERYPQFRFSVSATTRAKRPNEINGTHYYFLSRDEFLDAVEKGKLVEWEEIYGQYYGTLKQVVDEALHAGQTLIFDVDVKGGLSIKEKYPNESVLIFIRPPSFEHLKERLIRRRTEEEGDLRKRLDRVPMELEEGEKYDYIVVNDELDKTINEVDEIVRKAIEQNVSE